MVEEMLSVTVERMMMESKRYEESPEEKTQHIGQRAF